MRILQHLNDKGLSCDDPNQERIRRRCYGRVGVADASTLETGRQHLEIKSGIAAYPVFYGFMPMPNA